MAWEIHRVAYSVVDVEAKVGENESSSRWRPIGVSFLNSDGSETVLLDATPINGKIVLREKKQDDETPSAEPPAGTPG
jgi:hypothetical protein